MRTLLILGLLALTACSSMPKVRDLNKIEVGMTKNKVLEALGEPISTETESNYEYLYYQMKDDEGEKRQRLVVLQDGEVKYSGKPSGWVKPKQDNDKGGSQSVNVSVNPVNNINIGNGGRYPGSLDQSSTSDDAPRSSIEERRDREIEMKLKDINTRYPGLEHNCTSSPIYASNGDIVRYAVSCY